MEDITAGTITHTGTLGGDTDMTRTMHQYGGTLGSTLFSILTTATLHTTTTHILTIIPLTDISVTTSHISAGTMQVTAEEEAAASHPAPFPQTEEDR